jgi:hypothetical protein
LLLVLARAPLRDLFTVPIPDTEAERPSSPTLLLQLLVALPEQRIRLLVEIVRDLPDQRISGLRPDGDERPLDPYESISPRAVEVFGDLLREYDGDVPPDDTPVSRRFATRTATAALGDDEGSSPPRAEARGHSERSHVPLVAGGA